MQPRLIAAISNGWGDVIAIAVAVVAFSVWERRRTKADPSLVAREARYGRRLLSYGVLALVVLIVALSLDAIGVPGAAVIAFAAVLGVVGLIYVAPWLGPRRRR